MNNVYLGELKYIYIYLNKMNSVDFGYNLDNKVLVLKIIQLNYTKQILS